MQEIEVVSENKVAFQDKITPFVDLIKTLQVTNEATYKKAIEYTKQIKETISQIERYWKEPKSQAHSAWKAICEKENEMKKDLVVAEKKLKQELADYVVIKESYTKELEDQAASESGISIKLDSDIPASNGVSYRVDYNIVIEDISKIPTIMCGVQLLQADLSAIKNLIKLTNGKINIPGIKFEETKNVSIRR